MPQNPVGVTYSHCRQYSHCQLIRIWNIPLLKELGCFFIGLYNYAAPNGAWEYGRVPAFFGCILKCMTRSNSNRNLSFIQVRSGFLQGIGTGAATAGFTEASHNHENDVEQAWGGR